MTLNVLGPGPGDGTGPKRSCFEILLSCLNESPLSTGGSAMGYHVSVAARSARMRMEYGVVCGWWFGVPWVVWDVGCRLSGGGLCCEVWSVRGALGDVARERIRQKIAHCVFCMHKLNYSNAEPRPNTRFSYTKIKTFACTNHHLRMHIL